MTKILSCAVLGLLVASSSGVLTKGPGGGAGASSISPGNNSGPLVALLPLDLLPDSLERPATRREDCTSEMDKPGHGASVYAPGFRK